MILFLNLFFSTLTENIRLRRGKRQAINIPGTFYSLKETLNLPENISRN